jgi:hypothetical protein
MTLDIGEGYARLSMRRCDDTGTRPGGLDGVTTWLAVRSLIVGNRLPAHPAAAEVAHDKEHDEYDHDDDDDVLDTHRQHLRSRYYAARTSWVDVEPDSFEIEAGQVTSEDYAMHMSSRILLVLVAGAAIVAGWWVLFAINEVGVAVLYGVLWTVAVLVVARILLAVGFGYNRLTAKGPPDTANATDLGDLRERGVISTETYEAERARSSGDPDRSADRR